MYHPSITYEVKRRAVDLGGRVDPLDHLRCFKHRTSHEHQILHLRHRRQRQSLFTRNVILRGRRIQLRMAKPQIKPWIADSQARRKESLPN